MMRPRALLRKALGKLFKSPMGFPLPFMLVTSLLFNVCCIAFPQEDGAAVPALEKYIDQLEQVGLGGLSDSWMEI